MMHRRAFLATLAGAATFGALAEDAFAQAPAPGPASILNVSYDIARELFAAENALFVPLWRDKTGQTLTVNQSHAGSSRQARAILEGLEADVVTFNQVTDVEVLAKAGYVAKDWQAKFPNKASPYYLSLIHTSEPTRPY